MEGLAILGWFVHLVNVFFTEGQLAFIFLKGFPYCP